MHANMMTLNGKKIKSTEIIFYHEILTGENWFWVKPFLLR
jgi:hypothetical protein